MVDRDPYTDERVGIMTTLAVYSASEQVRKRKDVILGNILMNSHSWNYHFGGK